MALFPRFPHSNLLPEGERIHGLGHYRPLSVFEEMMRKSKIAITK